MRSEPSRMAYSAAWLSNRDNWPVSPSQRETRNCTIDGSVAKFDFSRKIEFLVAIDSMTYRIPHSSKTNFATEPKIVGGTRIELDSGQ